MYFSTSTHGHKRKNTEHTLYKEGNPRGVFAVGVQGLAGVLSRVCRVHCGEGQYAASNHRSGTHSVAWTSCNSRTVTPGADLGLCSDPKFLLNEFDFSPTRDRGRTDPFDGRRWVSSHCAAELRPLALLGIQH